MKNAWMRSAVLLLGIAMLSSSLGCAFGEIYWDDPKLREYSLQETSDLYTRLVRFGDLQQASRFVDPEQAIDFVDSFPRKGRLTFTDYEASKIQFEDVETRDKATIRVTYEGYFSDSPVIVEFVEMQEWYRVGKMNTWRVRSSFDHFELVASN